MRKHGGCRALHQRRQNRLAQMIERNLSRKKKVSLVVIARHVRRQRLGALLSSHSSARPAFPLRASGSAGSRPDMLVATDRDRKRSFRSLRRNHSPMRHERLRRTASSISPRSVERQDRGANPRIRAAPAFPRPRSTLRPGDHAAAGRYDLLPPRIPSEPMPVSTTARTCPAKRRSRK